MSTEDMIRGPAYSPPQPFRLLLVQLEVLIVADQPGDVILFSDEIGSHTPGSNDREYYRYPVLLANLKDDDPALPDYPEEDLVDEVIDYIQAAYTGAGDFTSYGLRGAEFNNVFSAMGSANHLDLTESRFDRYTTYEGNPEVTRRGILTYSINHLAPAIPQLAANVWFLDDVKDALNEIDEHYPYGDGIHEPPLTESEEDEVIMGNMMETEYGGSKFGIMRVDVMGFESNVGTDFNSSFRAQNFRRTVAREKNMARLLNRLSCLENVLNQWYDWETETWGCSRLNSLWGFHDLDIIRVQAVNEVAWMSLAWGFLPSITSFLDTVEWVSPLSDFDTFIDENIRELYWPTQTDDLGFTKIFKELHLAGWRPITNAVASDDTGPVDLVVERFGNRAGLNGQYVFFTVLNNETLTTTFADLVWPYDEGYPPCPDGYDCDDFP